MNMAWYLNEMICVWERERLQRELHKNGDTNRNMSYNGYSINKVNFASGVV